MEFFLIKKYCDIEASLSTFGSIVMESNIPLRRVTAAVVIAIIVLYDLPVQGTIMLLLVM